MKSKLFLLCIVITTTIIATLESCKKNQLSNTNNATKSIINGFYKSFPEIGLTIKGSYVKDTIDSFKVSVPDNFTLEQSNSLYNIELQMEYFILSFKKKGVDNAIYFVNGTIDSLSRSIIVYTISSLK